MKNLKLGIIGYGFMGQWHNNHAGTLDEVEINAICDIDPEQLKKAPKTAAHYTDYHDLLKDENVEWVVICIPNHLHRQAAIDAAKAKKNIIVEKPCALNVAEFDEMYAAARENGVIFTVDQNRRWDRDYMMVKKAMDEELLGKVYMLKSSHYGVFGMMNDWHVYKKCGGGMLYDWGVHLIDQVLDLFPDSKVTQVCADMKCVLNREVDDYFRILIYFDNGLAAEIELGTFLLAKMPRFYVAGDKGSMVVDEIKADSGAIYRAREVRTKLPETVTNLDAGPTRTFSSKREEVVYEEELPVIHHKLNDWNDFFRNIVGVANETEELIVKPEQVRRVLLVMEAAQKSAELRRSVDVE